MAFTPVTVSATFINPDGSTPSGSVTFIASSAMGNGTQIVSAQPRIMTLSNGSGSIVLEATDDVGTNPTGVTYTVIEAISGSRERQYSVALPKAATSVNLAALVPVTASSTPGYVLVADREALSTVASSGSAQTLDVSLAPVFDVTLTAACTFTFTGSVASQACGFTLILRQDGTGSRAVTWPASVKWASATAPTLSTGASKVDVVTFLTVDHGTTWLGFLSGLDLR